MFKRSIILALIISWLPLAAIAGVVSSATFSGRINDGDYITVDNWNNSVVGVYTYINNNVVAALNTLTAKGDLYGCTGTSIARVPVGANNTLLLASSANSNGVAWTAYSGESPLTTKGDIVVSSGAAITRLPVGADGTILTVDSTQPYGIKWSMDASNSPFPSGAIVSFSPAAGGSIPSDWVLCDGTNSTPNLIGRFVIGTRPNGSTATASSGGFGALTVDGNGSGAISHVHGSVAATPSIDGNGASSGNYSNCRGGSNFTTSTIYHTHSAAAAITRSISSSSFEPADYALVYIMKQ